MADKRVGINVQLKLDSEAFSRKVDSLADDFKPIEVPIKLKSLNVGAGIGTVRVKADVDPNTLTPSLTTSLKTAFGSVTAKLGEDIGEQVGKSVEKLKPSAFSGIVEAIASPFQKIATGALEGIGREMSAKLGRGLAKGVENQASPVIGSFELLGEKLVTTAAPRLGNTLGGKLAKSLFDKDAVKQAQQDFKQFLATTVNKTDALVASQSQKSRDEQKLKENVVLARQRLGGQLANFVATAPARQEQAAKLRDKDTQLVSEQQTAQQKVVTAQQAIASKRQELAQKQEQILKKLESQGVRVDDTLRKQVAKQVQSAPGMVQELAKLETEYAKSSQALTAIIQRRRAIGVRIKQLEAPISPIVAQLELLGVKQPEIAAIRKKIIDSNTEFNKIATNLKNSSNENISTIQNLRKDIAFYKKQLQALVVDYNFQLNFVSSKSEQKQLLEQVIQQRNEIIQQIQQAENDIKSAVAKIEGRQKLREEVISKRNAKTSEIEKEYIDPQTKLASQALGRPKKAANQPSASQLFPDAFSTPQIPTTYLEVIKQVAKASGVTVKDRDIPKLIASSKITGDASYTPSKNLIKVSPSDYKKIASGNIDPVLIDALVHEIRHAIQYSFGKTTGGKNVNLLTPTEQESQALNTRIQGSVSAYTQVKKRTPEQVDLVSKLETDAYTFADRYAKEIYNYITSLSNPKSAPNLKAKLTEQQKILNAARVQSQEQLFANLAAENKAALEQLTGKQLQAIARSSGVKGYSNKKVAELRQMLSQQVKPEELSFRIPLFSKVNPQVQQVAQQLAEVAPEQLKEQVRGLSKYFSQGIKKAGKAQDAEALRKLLDNISGTRKVYASVLAQDISQDTRNLLQTAVASLGKQRIAAQSRLTALDAKNLNTSSVKAANTVTQNESEELFAFSSPRISRPNVDLSFDLAKARRDEREAQLKKLNQNANTVQQDVTQLTSQINGQVSQPIINADKAIQRMSALVRASQSQQDKQAKKQQAAIAKSSEASFKQAQQSLKQLEVQVDRQVTQIEQRARYNQQQQQRKQSDRLRSYGIDQTAPVDIVEQRPQRQPFSVGRVFSQLRGEFQDFRASSAKKQAQALGQQSQAILVDLDSQIAIGKASVKESKLLQKQVVENEKRIQQIISKVRAAKEGRIPALTPGDLQRLSGQLQQLSTQVDADKLRLGELDPQIQRARRLQPVAGQLRSASTGAGAIASSKVSNEDLAKLNQYNRAMRQSLELLGQKPSGGSGGFFGDLNLKMPGLLKNVLGLVKGFLAFQTIAFIQQTLAGIGREALQTSIRFEQLEKSLDFATGGQGAESLAFVRKEVDRLSLPLESSIKAFTGLTAAARGTSLEGAQTEKIFSAVAQASRVYGLSAEQTEGALLALQQMISKGCYDRDTEVLTDAGWVYWEKVTSEHKFATIDLKTKQISYQLPTRLIRYRHTGKMLRVASPDVDLLVTPDHRMIVRDPNSMELTIVRASELEDKPYFYVVGKNAQEVLVLPEHLSWVNFDGEVFCAEVPNTTLYVRRNGKGCYSGNSVQSEELRGQLGERLPGAFQIFARSMGVTTAELSKLLEQGKVGLDDLSKFADQLAKETSGGVAGATKTAAASLQRLQNSFTDLNKQIGDAISPSAIAVFDALSASLDFVQKNANVVKAVLAAVAITATVALLPSILALGAAIKTLALVTLPLVAKSMFAIVVANPVLVASLAALTLTMLYAEDGAKTLANAITGVSQAQIDAADKDAQLDFKYNQALQQLQKQVPLSKEKIDELTKGLNDQARRGVNTARTTELLKNQLLKYQQRAEATAAAQAALNKQVADSEIAFKKAKNATDLLKLGGDLSTAKAKAQGLIADEAIKDREYESEQQHNLRMSGLYSSRINEIQSLLAESERLQKLGKKGLEAKQEKELREELLNNQKEFNQSQIQLANTEYTRTQVLRERRLKDFEEAQSILESKQKAGNLTEEKLLQERLVIQQQKGNEQIADIQQRRAKLSKTDREGLEALAVEEAKAYSDIKEAQKSAFDQRIALSQKRLDEELAVVTAARAKGVIDEAQFNQEQYDTRTKYLDDQLNVLKVRSATIAETDIDAQMEIASKEAQILQQRTEARKAFLDAQLAQLEREQQKASDLTTLATREREIELQKLVNSRVLNQEEVQTQTLKVTRTGIEKELELERNKLAQLQSFPRYDDPVEEEGRQAKIRQSRIRTSDLQLQLLQNEKSQQEAVYAAYAKAIDRVTGAIANRATIATQSFNKELLANTVLEKSLSLQNQLLDAQKNLRSALSGYVDAEFQILQETAKSEREKKQLAESAANVKLQAARIQAQLDQQSLELQIQQADQAQRRLEIENAIAQIRNRADIATKQAESAKVAADPNATPEQKEAAQLQVVAAQAEGVGLQEEAGFLAQQREVNNRVNNMRRQTQDLQRSANISRAEFEAAQAIANPRERRRRLRELRGRAGERVFGANATTERGDYLGNLRDYNAANRGEALTPLEAYRANQVQNRVTPALPQIELPKVMPILNQTVTNLGTAVDSLVQLVQKKLSTPANVTITTPINNYFPTNPNPKDVASNITQAIRKEQYDLATLLNRA